jgi:SAM-dependent methyltransferase
MSRHRSIKERIYPESAFGGLTHFDGGARYYSRVQTLVKPESVVLDYGCGRGIHASESNAFYRSLCSFKGKVKRVIGVDPTDGGLRNLDLDEFRQMKDASIPLDNETVDLCHADWVIEHVQDIDIAFHEVHRVLKPGGYFCFRTPNLFHYSSIGASIVPFAAHYRLRQLVGHPHEAEDVFPTTYPCNTKWRARRLFRAHGFESLVYYHRSASLLMGLGYWPGLFGRLIETLCPPFLWHEIHAFGRKIV